MTDITGEEFVKQIQTWIDEVQQTKWMHNPEMIRKLEAVLSYIDNLTARNAALEAEHEAAYLLTHCKGGAGAYHKAFYDLLEICEKAHQKGDE